MNAYYLGIDPGLNGAFAVISGDQIRFKLVMPLITTAVKEDKIKKEIDRNAVLSFLTVVSAHATIPSPVYVAIEEQEAFRKQNITSTCTTCKNYGILLMALTATQMNYVEVPPSVWQSHFGIVSAKEGKGTTKEQAFHIAQKLYPKVDFRKSGRSHIVHDGMVDAMLIATYGQDQKEEGVK